MHFTRDYIGTFDVYPKANPMRGIYTEDYIEKFAERFELGKEERMNWETEYYTPFMPAVLGKCPDGYYAYTELHDTSPVLIGGLNGTGKTTIIDSIIDSMRMRDPLTAFYMIDLKGDRRIQYHNKKRIVYVDHIKPAMAVLQYAVENLIESDRRDYFAVYAEIDRSSAHAVVILIDEFAELMLQERALFEKYIRTIALKGRQHGVYLVATTQYVIPEVITALFRSSFSTRICLRVNQAAESQTVTGLPGAQDLAEDYTMVCCERGTQRIFGLRTDTERHVRPLPENVLNQIRAKYHLCAQA